MENNLFKMVIVVYIVVVCNGYVIMKWVRLFINVKMYLNVDFDLGSGLIKL